MKVKIHSQNLIITTAYSNFIKRRLWFALGRFGYTIKCVTIYLTNESESDGSKTKRCSIVVRLVRYGQVRIEDSDRDLSVAIIRAVHRVGQAVSRELEHLREMRNYIFAERSDLP